MGVAKKGGSVVYNVSSRAEIFKRVETRELQAEEAYRMIREMERGKSAGSKGQDLLEEIKETLRDAVADILKYNKKSISSSSNFREFGFSSFSLMGFKKYIDAEYDIDLRPDAFFESPTINQLASYLLNHHRDSVLQSYGKGAMEPEVTGKRLSSEDSKNEDSQWELGSQKPVPERMVLKKQPIWLLHAGKKFPAELLENFWENLREKRMNEIPSEKISTGLLELLVESGYKYLHMLVEVSTGEKMEVFSAGKGETIVIISGIGATATLTYNQLKNFSSQYRFIVFHVPGSGLSEGVRDLSLESIAGVVRETLEKLGVESPVHIFGGSWGAMVAITFAKNYPAKTASMVLMCPVVDLLGSEGTGESSVEHLASINEIARRDILAVSGGEKYLKLYSKSICADALTLSNYMKHFSSDSPDFYSTVSLLEDIEAPALVVTGSQDSMAEKRHKEILRSKLKNVTCFEIQGAGHFPALTHSGEFNSMLGNFFEEVKGNRR